MSIQFLETSPNVSAPIFCAPDEPAHLTIRAYGNTLRHREENFIERHRSLNVINEIVSELGLPDVVWHQPAKTNEPGGRSVVHEYPPRRRMHTRPARLGQIHSDGIILRQPGQGVALATRDCPTVIIWSALGGPVAVLHASRDALHGIDVGRPERSVIGAAFALCGKEWRYAEHLSVAITLSIAAEHFGHNDDGSGRFSDIVWGMERLYGGYVLPDAQRETLDLPMVIMRQLAIWGIHPEQCFLDGLDTYADERLASRRAHQAQVKPRGHNLVIVSYDSAS